MVDRAWKKFERRLARRVGGRRVPVSGIERGSADVIAPLFCYQAKLRKGVPGYLKSWVHGIVAAGVRAGSIGVVVWKAPHERDANSLVILRLRDWEDLHGPGKEKPALAGTDEGRGRQRGLLTHRG